MIERFVDVCGWAVVGFGSTSVLLFILWLLSEAAWRVVRNLYSWPWLFRAIKYYSAKVERPPFDKGVSK